MSIFFSVHMSDMCRHGPVVEATPSAESNINSALFHFLTSPSFKNLQTSPASVIRDLLSGLPPAFAERLTRLDWRLCGMTGRCRLCYAASTVDMTLHTQTHTRTAAICHTVTATERVQTRLAHTCTYVLLVDCIISHCHCHRLLQTRYPAVPLPA